MMKYLFLFLVFVNPLNLLLAQNELISNGAAYKYKIGSSSISSDWNQPGFDDSGWQTGYGGIGYGDNDDQTTIEACTSVYLRFTFSINDTAALKELSLFTDFDDGFRAYVNGGLFASVNLGSHSTSTTWDQVTERPHEAEMYRWVEARVPCYYIGKEFIKGHFKNGQNVLAIEVHNDAVNGSDLSFLCALYDMTGSWFNMYDERFRYVQDIDLDSTPLPIIKIETDEYGFRYKHVPVIADMQVIFDSAQTYQKPEFLPNHYNGQIRIEIKGESSSDYAKRSYKLETQNTDGTNLNIPLLGMPAGNDWILMGPYQDKSQIRNAFVFDLGRKQGHYEPRYHFCELILNGQNQGLYMLTEKIRRDKYRVDISKLEPTELSGDGLTGGYIFKYDKGASGIQLVYPDADEIPYAQGNYIHSFVDEFYSGLQTNHGLDHQTGYRKYVSHKSLIDYILVNEMTKNADSYLYSTFGHLVQDSEDGRIHYGPLWDYDLGFGNTMFQEGNLTHKWQFDYNKTLKITRMLQDTALVRILNERWRTLRAGEFSNTRVLFTIDSMVASMKTSIERNNQVWPVIDKYLFNPAYIPNNYEEEIAIMKNWLTTRLAWMDSNLPKISYPVTVYQGIEVLASTQNGVSVFPNPFDTETTIQFEVLQPATVTIELMDSKGSVVFRHRPSQVSVGINDYRWNGVDAQNRALPSGLYVLRITSGGSKPVWQKLVKL